MIITDEGGGKELFNNEPQLISYKKRISVEANNEPQLISYKKRISVEALTFLYFVAIVSADASINVPREEFKYPFYITRENLFLSLAVSAYYTIRRHQRENVAVQPMGEAARTAFNVAFTTAILWAAVLLPTEGLPENNGDRVFTFFIHLGPFIAWLLRSKIKQERITTSGFGVELKSFAPTAVFIAWAAFLIGIYSAIDSDNPVYDIIDWSDKPGYAAAITGGSFFLGFGLNFLGKLIINSTSTDLLRSIRNHRFFPCKPKHGVRAPLLINQANSLDGSLNYQQN